MTHFDIFNFKVKVHKTILKKNIFQTHCFKVFMIKHPPFLKSLKTNKAIIRCLNKNIFKYMHGRNYDLVIAYKLIYNLIGVQLI